MSASLSLEETAQYLTGLKGKGKILLAAHVRPDGDALGSVFGLLTVLRENGFDAETISPENIPDYFREFVPETGMVAQPSADDLKKYILFIPLDSARRDRVAAVFFAEGNAFPIETLNIDHHPDNPLFGDRNVIVSNAGATAEIVTNLARTAGWKISAKAATLLLIGILTDTGGFRFRNTSPGTLRTASYLMEAGGEYDHVINACFFSKPEGMARFEADLLCNHLKRAFDGRFLYVYFEPEVLSHYGIELRNTEQVIEILRAIAGPVIVATIRKEQGGFKCSLRSKDTKYSVGRVARNIGGGGHELAAGCSIKTDSLDEAVQILLSNVEKELNEK